MIADWSKTKAKESIDPERVRIALASLFEAWPGDLPPLQTTIESLPTGEAAFLHLLAISPVSTEKLLKDPVALTWLAQPAVCQGIRGTRRMRIDLEELKKSETGFDPSFRALRQFKSREMLRIALREVAGLSSLEQTTQELSQLAEICLREVCDGWHADLTRRWGAPKTDFAVLGMGKFGGLELNYSSDIDVIFLYGEDGELNPRFTHQDFFTRLCEKIVATFSSTDQAGTLFRIDLRLRPEGASGPLVRSFESMENYYAGFGETWERMALIKARGVAGSEELAYEFSQYLQPFIFPRMLSPDVFEEIRTIKARIERDIVGHEELTRNVKLGYGGIREIEFVVQALQLIHGARHAFLQERSTLKVLRSAQQINLLPPEDVTALTEAYRFLRTVEHRLQIEQEAQTHTIPTSPAAVGRLAASLKFASTAHFQAEFARHTGSVRGIFDRLLHSQDTQSGTEKARDTGFFQSASQAEKALQSLQGSTATHVAPRTKQLFAKLEPLLLDRLKNIADPDLALNRFVRFVERYGIRGLLYETLVTNPRLLELLLKLFDASRFQTDIVLRRPQLIEEVTREGSLSDTLSITQHLAGLSRNEEKLSWMDWVRVYRRSQILRIFLRDILEFATIQDVQAEYSALAEACLLFVIRKLEIESDLTVIAMGKFGGREASYGCDLDVVFVGDNIAAAEHLIKAMTATTDEGIVFPVDARLRPEGQSGVLVLPIASYEAYFEHRAQLWEAQALTKARPVSGPLCKSFATFAKSAWQKFGTRPDLFDDIKAMHQRVVRARASADDFLDFKTGVGGLMELEFLIQALQMKSGVWENNTVAAMEKVGVELKEPYLFLRRCEAVIRRVENSSTSTLPLDVSDQFRLARRLGFTSRDQFSETYSKARGKIHKAFQTHMGSISVDH